MEENAVFEQKFAVTGGNFANAGLASVEVKNLLKKMGVDPVNVRRISISVYEAEMNVVLYAKRGVITLKVSPEMVVFTVDDEGPGIEDIPLAMSEGFSTADEAIRELGFGSGMGLPNIRSNADYLAISSAPGKGVKLEAAFNLAEAQEVKEGKVEEKVLSMERKEDWCVCVWKLAGFQPRQQGVGGAVV